MNRKTGKCPKCCPEGGAIFHAESNYNYETEKFDRVWICQNCGEKLPRRVVSRKPTKPTPTQEDVLAKLKEAFGGEIVRTELIGRTFSFKIENESRAWYKGRLLAGFIGPNGKMDVTLYRLGGDVKINDDIAISVYLQ